MRARPVCLVVLAKGRTVFEPLSAVFVWALVTPCARVNMPHLAVLQPGKRKFIVEMCQWRDWRVHVDIGAGVGVVCVDVQNSKRK